ncbi:hypothetical protein LUW76_34985 [Actinomadura madurae]|uniref:hypothetical protein n=1 Tax=Actinomadura madurae TaxID=1993 RepID=UPI002026A1A7|nr:hypothetical protein [Actinomadura madurae]URM99120.1 hypothetical protein LUW76_34985 [Actinomadura madurae]
MTANSAFDSGPAAEIRLCRSFPLDHVPVDPDGAARQADTAEDDEHDRDEEAQRDVGVLQRVQREVALRHHAAIARPVRHVRVPELVQRQRQDPRGDHEPEQRDPSRPLQDRPVPPGDQAAQDGRRHDREEHRTRPDGRAPPHLVCRVLHRCRPFSRLDFTGRYPLAGVMAPR